jgi:hypothetical protein
VRPDDRLILIRVIKTDWVVQVRNIDSSDVVAKCESEVSELAVIRNIGVDGKCILRLVAETDEKFCNTLAAIGVLAERVDDPDLARNDSSGESGGLRVAWDELDVLDTATLCDCELECII